MWGCVHCECVVFRLSVYYDHYSIGEWIKLIQWFWIMLAFHLVIYISKDPFRKYRFASHYLRFLLTLYLGWVLILFLIRSQDYDVRILVAALSDCLFEILLHCLAILIIYSLLVIFIHFIYHYKKRWIHAFNRLISVKWTQRTHLQFELCRYHFIAWIPFWLQCFSDCL